MVYLAKRQTTVLAGLALVLAIVASASLADAQTEVETVMLEDKEAVITDRIGHAFVLRAKGAKITVSVGGSSRDARLEYDWYMVQDSALGIVFRKPSGIKYNSTKAEFDGDIDLQALVNVLAVEVRAVTFDVWRMFTGTLTTTKIRKFEADKKFNFDPRWGLFARPNRHYISIMYIARVFYEDGRIVEADSEPVLRAARRLWEDITVENLLPEYEEFVIGADDVRKT